MLAGVPSLLGLLLSATEARGESAARPYCAPELSAIAENVCSFQGAASADGPSVLVVYLHGALPDRPGLAYVQQRGMVLHAKKHGFTLLFAASPEIEGYRVWPRSRALQEAHELRVVEGLTQMRDLLQRERGGSYDRTFVVGFSSGAYYAGSLALRGVLDVDGYVILAGGSPERVELPAGRERVPVFVGVSAADRTTASGARSLASELLGASWPSRVEEQNAGHLVDWTLLAHGLVWLGSQADARDAAHLAAGGTFFAASR